MDNDFADGVALGYLLNNKRSGDRTVNSFWTDFTGINAPHYGNLVLAPVYAYNMLVANIMQDSDPSGFLNSCLQSRFETVKTFYDEHGSFPFYMENGEMQCSPDAYFINLAFGPKQISLSQYTLGTYDDYDVYFEQWSTMAGSAIKNLASASSESGPTYYRLVWNRVYNRNTSDESRGNIYYGLWSIQNYGFTTQTLNTLYRQRDVDPILLNLMRLKNYPGVTDLATKWEQISYSASEVRAYGF